MTRKFYVEHDGRVLIVHRKDRMDLPTQAELDVPLHESTRRELEGVEVVFGQAKLDEHPLHWPVKDELASDPNATSLVHAAVNASLFRPVVSVVVTHGPDLLLVRPARGVVAGRWTLPGGFLHAFEEPVAGARREVREETGVELSELRLATVVTYSHAGSPYPILGLAYVGAARSRELAVRREEIAEARWVPIDEARKLSGGLAGRVLELVAKEGTL